VIASGLALMPLDVNWARFSKRDVRAASARFEPIG